MEKRIRHESEGQKDKRKEAESQEDEHGLIDDVIGSFGKYQFLVLLFKIMIGATSAFNNLGVTFYAPKDFVSYWCADNPTLALANSTSHLPMALPIANQSYEHHRNPQSLDIISGFLFGEERESRHNAGFGLDKPVLRKECSYVSPIDNRTHKCNTYQYDTGIWQSTIIDEWDLVCNQAWLVSATQSFYMSSFLIAYLVFGYLSDKFGRWRSLLIGAILEISGGLGCAFAGSITSFMIARFCLGIGNAGRSSSSYLIMIEWAGPKWRMEVSTLGVIGWVLGYSLMPWISLYFLHFRHMQLFVCVYEMICVICLIWLPESPRWLLTHKRFDEAHDVLLMAARFNGLIREDRQIKRNKSMKELTLDGESHSSFNDRKDPIVAYDIVEPIPESKTYTIEEFGIRFKRLVKAISAKEFTKNEHRLSLFDLFKWRNLRNYTLIFAFVWACDSFTYYGMVLSVGDFAATNLFVSFTIAGITELPSLAFTIICMKSLPRRMTNIVLFSGVALLCSLQVPLMYFDCQKMQQVNMTLAKFFNSCSFISVLYQTMELFPTSIRQTAYSTCSLFGRFGSILAPFIKDLAALTNPMVPPAIYANLSLIVIVLMRKLPETKGSDLPDTLSEAENFKGTDKKKISPTPTTVNMLESQCGLYKQDIVDISPYTIKRTK